MTDGTLPPPRHDDARGAPESAAAPPFTDQSLMPSIGGADLPATHEQLAAALRHQQREFDRLRLMIEKINRGLRIEEVLDFLYDEFRDVIPYNRISFAAYDPADGNVVSRWARSDRRQQIAQGYSFPLAKSSLREIVRSGRPRIINDLEAYLREHPASQATQLLVDEQLRSSLTCPLLIEGRPVGFLFFDAEGAAAYSDAHIEFFMEIAGVVAVVLERSRTFSELAERNATIEHQNRLLADENERNQQELELARRVQRTLIPETLPQGPGLSLAMLYEPAQQIGGDLVDAIRLSPAQMLLCVADAVGHGVSAALLMSAVSTAFHGAVDRQRSRAAPGDAVQRTPGGAVPPVATCSPAAILAEINRTIAAIFDMNFVTAICGLIDLDAQQLVLASAGHPPALIVRSAGGPVIEADIGGLPLGIEIDAQYEDAVLPLGPGDLLLLYTDGVTEAADPRGDFYDLPKLKEFLLSRRGRSAEALMAELRQALKNHCGCAKLQDDLTVLAAKMAE